MKKYFATLNFGFPGCESHELIVADTEEEAQDIAYDMCIDLASSYGFEQDEYHFGDRDTVGKDWDEDAEDYVETGFLDPSVEEYDPLVHDNYLN
jgi:hypothetical protein